MAGPLSIEIVTPLGRVGTRTGIDEIVLRRFETAFDPGSEVAVFPGHAPMLVRITESDIRLEAYGKTRWAHVGPGFAQVRDDRVLVLAQSGRFDAAPVRRPCDAR
jgi:F0F1-type ATP synthase epsilon subunit